MKKLYKSKVTVGKAMKNEGKAMQNSSQHLNRIGDSLELHDYADTANINIGDPVGLKPAKNLVDSGETTLRARKDCAARQLVSEVSQKEYRNKADKSNGKVGVLQTWEIICKNHKAEAKRICETNINRANAMLKTFTELQEYLNSVTTNKKA